MRSYRDPTMIRKRSEQTEEKKTFTRPSHPNRAINDRSRFLPIMPVPKTQPLNYTPIALNEHRPQSYPSTEVQPDEADKSSIYQEEYDNKQSSDTLLENHQLTKPESSPAYTLDSLMIHEGDPPPQYTSVGHILVETDNAPTNNIVPVNADQPTPSTFINPCLSENQTVTIPATTEQRRTLNPWPRDKDDNLCLAIFACVFCCFPFGLVAIGMAMEANEARRRCDYDAVRRYNRKAYIWMISAVVFGIISFILIGLRG